MQVTPTPYVWMDGCYVPWDDAKVHVLTPTLHYGWGVFEGIRAYPSPTGPRVFRLDAHLDRLWRSARMCGITIPYEREVLFAAILGVAARSGLDACYIRPVVYAVPGEMGIDPTPMAMRAFVAAWRWDNPITLGPMGAGIRACVAGRRRNLDAAVPSGAKACGLYLNSAMARAEAVRAGHEEAIMLNADGNVADACVANVFAVRDGRLFTPPLADGPLRGITRDTVLRLARVLCIDAAEHPLRPGDLRAADEIFLTGTASGVAPVAALDGHRVGDGRVGPVTDRLYHAYQDVVLSRNTAFASWLTGTHGR